jgi:hypothetical protein
MDVIQHLTLEGAVCHFGLTAAIQRAIPDDAAWPKSVVIQCLVFDAWTVAAALSEALVVDLLAVTRWKDELWIIQWRAKQIQLFVERLYHSPHCCSKRPSNRSTSDSMRPRANQPRLINVPHQPLRR